MKTKGATSGPEAHRLLFEGALALSKMERIGMKLDLAYLDRAIRRCEGKIKKYTEKLKADAVWVKTWNRMRFGKNGTNPPNLDSPQQLAEVLYDRLGFECVKFTEKGSRSTDEEALADIDLSFVRNYVRRKKLEKLLSTYLLNYKKSHIGGYLHGSYGYTEPFRSSMNSPNLQNVPARGKSVQIVLDCFIPEKGHRLVFSDFAQIEVRVAACYTHDPELIRYINDPSTCMHRDTAMELFLLKKDQVEKKTTRDWAKNRFVFPQFYGSYWKDCADNIWKAVQKESNKLPDGRSVLEHLRSKGIYGLDHVSGEIGGKSSGRLSTEQGTFYEHVRQVERRMWDERFTVYRDWKRKWFQDYCERGYFETLTGFRFANIYDRKEACNYPIQGSSFHCLLWSIIELQKLIRKYKLKTKIVNEIHDSLIADVPEDELQDWLYITRDVMTKKCVKHFPWLIVPLEVEQEVTPVGGTWFDKKQFVEKNGSWEEA